MNELNGDDWIYDVHVVRLVDELRRLRARGRFGPGLG